MDGKTAEEEETHMEKPVTGWKRPGSGGTAVMTMAGDTDDYGGGSSEHRLNSLRVAFEAFVVNPQVNGTVDGFYNTEEKYRGLCVPASYGGRNLVGQCEPAFSYHTEWEIHPRMRTFLSQHNAWAEFHDHETVMVYLI